MVEEGSKMAYVPAAGIHHHHLTGFLNYLKKYRWRVRNSLYQKDIGFDNRNTYLSVPRKVKKYLWMIYGLTLVGPLFHGIWWMIRDRELCWLWHFPASVGLAYLILIELVRKTALDFADVLKRKREK